MKKKHWLLCCAAIALVASCRQSAPTPVNPPALLPYFPERPQGDTLHVEVAMDEDTLILGDTIPNRLFFNTIPFSLLQEIEYVVDSSAELVLGRQRFLLDDHTEAYWVEIRQFWFQHHSLLLYDKLQHKFTERITLAEWYGGEGGQVLTGSWLFDFDGDGKTDILIREIQHSIQFDGETELERTEESASLLLWKNGRFEQRSLQDTAAVIRRYPIQTMW